jgi:hypothetical protein
VETLGNLGKFFSEALDGLSCQEDTRAYIIGVFVKYRSAEFDLSRENLTLTFAQARFNRNFLLYQALGDWIFYAGSLYPQSLTNASESYYQDLARLSYYACYNIINRQWRSYQELADNFVDLEQETHRLIYQALKAT